MRLICNNFMLFLLFLLSVTQTSHSAQLPHSSNTHRCLNDQKGALIQLQKDVLSHNSSSVTFDDNSLTKVAKWDKKTDCCLWDGVTCDHSGNVIGLNLSYSRLSGHIDAIFHLRHLQRLNLAGNNFQLTPVPSGFERLTNLTHLNISYSCFSDQIPAGISRLTRLESLDLSTVFFCELPPTFNDPDFNYIFATEELHRLRLERPNLESFVRNLRALTELRLDYVDLSAQGPNWSQALSALPNLKNLSLSHCRLSGTIHSSFENLKFLNSLKLDNNNLSSEVPHFLDGFRDLQVLNLASTQLYGNFPGKVFLLPRLQTIDLSTNPLLTGELPEFPLHSSLQFVSVFGTNFRGKLPDSIGNLKYATNLLLYNCNFSGLIPPSLANLTSLTEMDISYNSFEGSIPSFRGSSVPKLQDLRLSSNRLTGPIDPLIFTLPSLKILYLNDNRLSGKLEDFSASSSVLEQVYLNGNNLSGEIPGSISEIPSLTILSLAANKFTGPVKLEAFQKLSNLTSLELSLNSLTIGVDQPDLMFPSLQELKLSKCNLTEFPTFLRKQEQLRTLNLSNNQIQGYVPKWLWTSSFNELDLSANKVDFAEESSQGDEGNNTFFPYLGKLVMRSCNVLRFPEFLKLLDALWYLDLSGNKIEGQVPSWIWKSTLQYVNISHNSLNSMEEFPPNVSLNSLATVDLRGNSLQGSLPRGICNLSSLSIFDASHNHLGGSIPGCLGLMGNLSVLNLQGNKYQRIPSVFVSGSSLRSLNLNTNLLKGQLPRSLANCKMLEVLDLGNNMITDEFPFWMDKLPNLAVLVLRNNSFYGQIQLPRRNFSLPKLGIIDISFNQFTGHLPQEFLESLDEMSMNWESKTATPKTRGNEFYQDSVTIMSKGTEMVLMRIFTIFVSLDLSNNRFHGKIPGEIGELKSLIVLNLSRNAFDGKIPSSLGNLVQLEYLDLSHNKLSGTLPRGICNVSSLSIFDASHNHLGGSIPECLGLMGNLSVLNLQRNKYQRIPSEFASASILRSLNINSNLLRGQLPRSLANCKMLEVLDLGNNMITDEFPFWMEKLPNLKVLLLRNNSFFGKIQLPRRNFSLPNLQIIDLSSNQFTGDLPQEFLESLDEMLLNSESKSASLKTIGQYEYYQDSVTIMSKGTEMVLVRILTIFVSLDLSNNRFHGRIPGEIGELKSLIVLNLSRNAFDGKIPSSLGNLVELESLDLSQNKLSGTIPQQLISLTFLSFFNASYNNLTGTVPQGNQFNTFANESYLGNIELCGEPLSKKCTGPDESTPQPPSGGESSENESLFDWKFALSGFISGVVVGFSLGYTYLPDFQYRRGRLQLKGRGRR